MRLTADDFQHLLDPPSVILAVADQMVVWIEPDVGKSFTGMVLRIQHPDLSEPYDQLFRVTPVMAARLAQALLDHTEPPEE